MDNNPDPLNSLYTQVEVSTDNQSKTAPTVSPVSTSGDPVNLMQQILAALDRQNEILEEMLTQTNAAQRSRANELGQWKQANPQLAKNCRTAAETLSKVQTTYLETVTEEVVENGEALVDGEFVFTEFVDRFGPRLAHLNSMLQILTQLSAPQ